MPIADERLARLEGALVTANARLARIERLQADYFRVGQEIVDMARETQQIVNDLKMELERNRNATQSAKVMLDRFIEAAREKKDDPDELEAVLDGFKANTDVLAAASANTSGNPIPQQTVPVDQPKTEAQGDVAQTQAGQATDQDAANRGQTQTMNPQGIASRSTRGG